MSSVTELIAKQMIGHEAPTPGGSTVGTVYKQWSSAEGIERQLNLDAAYNAFADVKMSMKVMDVASGLRQRLANVEDFETAIMEDAAYRAAKALVLLDLFGETGVIELQTQYMTQLEQELHKYEDRPPF